MTGGESTRDNGACMHGDEEFSLLGLNEMGLGYGGAGEESVCLFDLMWLEPKM